MRYDFPSAADAAFPKMTVVSITNTCDFACRHCYYPCYAARPDYQRHDMETPVFRKIADEIGQHPRSILRLIAWGEPLLHTEIVEFTAYAGQVAPQAYRTLITNGYWLTPDVSCALMEAGLNLVEISIDAARSETYERWRVSTYPDAFSRVEENVKAMIRQRNGRSLRTRIVVSFIVHPDADSAAEFREFARRWSGVADEVVNRPAHTFKGRIRVPDSSRRQPRPPCYGLWARCNINPWGQISVCYNDWANAHILGDLRNPDTTIAAVWQGQDLTQLRRQQKAGIFRGICASCRDYNPDAWNRPYEHVVGRCCVNA